MGHVWGKLEKKEDFCLAVLVEQCLSDNHGQGINH